MTRKRQTQDSLELFLDTICNMFGGFVFIMLFVVVSLRVTTEKTIDETVKEEQASAVELAELEIELEALKSQWSAVSERVEEARKFLSELGSTETANVQRETLDVLDELARLSEVNASKSANVAEIQRQALEIDALKKSYESELADARRTLQNAQDDVVAARKLASRNASPPQMRERYGLDREVGVVLKYGRLYFWHRYVDGVRVFNAEDFHIVSEDGVSARTEPLPWRGVDLNAPDVASQLEQAFASCNPRRESIAIIVAADSYDEYVVVRNFLKDRLFRIRPLVGAAGSKVYDRGGSDGRSQ